MAAQDYRLNIYVHYKQGGVIDISAIIVLLQREVRKTTQAAYYSTFSFLIYNCRKNTTL